MYNIYITYIGSVKVVEGVLHCTTGNRNLELMYIYYATDNRHLDLTVHVLYYKQ